MGDYERYIKYGDKSFHTEIFDLEIITIQLERIVIDVSIHKEFIENATKDFFDLHLDGVKIRVRNYYNELEEKYKDILLIKNKFDSLEKMIKNNRVEIEARDIVKYLELLKETDAFVNIECTKFIEQIYKTCYEYMKLEFLHEDDSRLLKYFLSNNHDTWYLNKFITDEIEELSNSINYILGLKELKLAIKELKDDNYLDKRVLQLLSICNYLNIYKKNVTQMTGYYLILLQKIYNKLITTFKEPVTLDDTFGYDDYDYRLLIDLKDNYIIYDKKLEDLINTKGFLLDDKTLFTKIDDIRNKLFDWITRIEKIESKRINLITQKQENNFKMIRKWRLL